MRALQQAAVVYAYTFPTALKGAGAIPVKFGSTTQRPGESVLEAADRRIREQVGTSNAEQPQRLLAIAVPDLMVERLVHSHLKGLGRWVADAPGREWFSFPSEAALRDFLDQLLEASLAGDFSQFGSITELLAMAGTEPAWAALQQAEGVLSFNAGCTDRVQIPTYFGAPFMEALADLYPGFRGWLQRSLQGAKTHLLVGLDPDGKWAGLLLWKERPGKSEAKLCCWWVAPWARRQGLGSRLMRKAIGQWEAAEVGRVVVTARHQQVVEELQGHGFLLEGFGRGEYGVGEHHCARLMLSGAVALQELEERIFPAQAVAQQRPGDGAAWDRLAYPAALSGGEAALPAAMVPIRPPYLRRLLANRRACYFGSPRLQLQQGARAYIYATSPLSAVVGEARVGLLAKGPAMEIWLPNQHRGVLSREEFTTMYQREDKIVQMTELKGLVLYPEPLPLDELVERRVLAAHPQGMVLLDAERIAALHEVKRRHG